MIRYGANLLVEDEKEQTILHKIASKIDDCNDSNGTEIDMYKVETYLQIVIKVLKKLESSVSNQVLLRVARGKYVGKICQTREITGAKRGKNGERGQNRKQTGRQNGSKLRTTC